MGEPWAAFGDLGDVGLPGVVVATIARSEAREAAAERRRLEERQAEAEERHEAYLYRYLQEELTRAAYDRRPGVDPANPATFVLSPTERAVRVFAEEDQEAAGAAFRAKVASGELHLLNIPASEMAPSRPEPSPDQEELADAWMGRMQQRTEHAGVVARIRRGLRGRPA